MTQETLTRTATITNDWLPASDHRVSQQQLTELYRRPGPFATVYLGFDGGGDDARKRARRRWADLRDHLELSGASKEMLTTIDRHLDRPAPGRTACLGIIAAQDGYSVVSHDVYPPASDRAVMSPLPEIGHLIEWQQRKIPTLVVIKRPGKAHIAGYAIDQLRQRYSVTGDLLTISKTVERLAGAVEAELVVVVGHKDQTATLAGRLSEGVSVTCRVTVEAPARTVDDLALATLRQIGICEAGTTLRHLREQRFLSTHGAAVDGVADTVHCLTEGAANMLLVNARRRDDRTVWIGSEAQDISLSKTSHTPIEVPLIDGMIRSATLQQIRVRIVPSLGPSGPEDDVAAVSSPGGMSLEL